MIGLYLAEGFQLLDMTGPASAFEFARGYACRHLPVEVTCLSHGGGLITSSVGIEVMTAPVKTAVIDTLIVVGGRIDPLVTAVTSQDLVAAASRCHRVAGVCTGAFGLAAAGLLDGRAATTHWEFTERFASDYPRVSVQPQRIYCRDGGMWTSGGMAAGVDMALAMIEDDFGPDASRHVAQVLLYDRPRHGGQAQLDPAMATPPRCARIAEVLRHARHHLDQSLSVEWLAERANMSVRQFSRQFREQTGTTPAKAIERLRVDAARGRLASSVETIERISVEVGFCDTERMRRAFVRHLGVPPQSLRSGGRKGGIGVLSGTDTLG